MFVPQRKHLFFVFFSGKKFVSSSGHETVVFVSVVARKLRYACLFGYLLFQASQPRSLVCSQHPKLGFETAASGQVRAVKHSF